MRVCLAFDHEGTWVDPGYTYRSNVAGCSDTPFPLFPTCARCLLKLERPWIMLVGDSNSRNLMQFIVRSLRQELLEESGVDMRPLCVGMDADPSFKVQEHSDVDCIFSNGIMVSLRFLQSALPDRLTEIFESDWKPRYFDRWRIGGYSFDMKSPVTPLPHLDIPDSFMYQMMYNQYTRGMKYSDGPSAVMFSFGTWFFSPVIPEESFDILKRVKVPVRVFHPAAHFHTFIADPVVMSKVFEAQRQQAGAELGTGQTADGSWDFLDIAKIATSDRVELINPGWHWWWYGNSSCIPRLLTQFLFSSVCNLVHDSAPWLGGMMEPRLTCGFPGHRIEAETGGGFLQNMLLSNEILRAIPGSSDDEDEEVELHDKN